MGFLNWRSDHTKMLMILGAMAIPIIVNLYYPEYLQISGLLSIGGIMALVFGIAIWAVIEGPRYPHIDHTIYDSVTGIPFATKEFFINREPEPGAPVVDVWPMKKDEVGQTKPEWMFGRWWYPYLVRTRLSVSFGDFKNISLHIFVLPHLWSNFLGFGRREEAAVWEGEVISIGSSTHLDSILAPFKVDYVGTEIPVYLGILSTYTIRKITKGWEDDMKELARFLGDMNALIEQEKEHIFPKVQLEDMLQHVMPLVKIPGYKKERENNERTRK